MTVAPGATALPESSMALGRLLLVEDSRIFADLLADRMRAEPGVEAVDVASTLSEARADTRRARPDLVLLDFHLGEESGLDLLEELDRMAAPPRVLMLSGDDRPEHVLRALRAGAQGWVTKTAAFDVLMQAIGEVVRGNMYLAPQALGPVLRRMLDRGRGERGFVDDLSPRQLEVLRCVVAGMSRAECAERLHLSINTVRTHMQLLLRRAGVHSTLGLASLARDLGVVGIDDVTTPDDG